MLAKGTKSAKDEKGAKGTKGAKDGKRAREGCALILSGWAAGLFAWP